MGAALLAASGSVILAAVPYVVAAAAIARLRLPRLSRMVPFLGCGCGNGPSALSLPGAAATAIAFGFPVAAARFAAALAVRRFVPRTHACNDGPLRALHALALPAFGAGLLHVAGASLIRSGSPLRDVAAGAIAAFFAAPCALAVPQLASVLRVLSPGAAAGFLCVAGIVDARAVAAKTDSRVGGDDGFAFALLAAACGVCAARHGASLIVPSFTPLLWWACATCAAWSAVHRNASAPRMRIAPLVALCATFVSAPAPAYHVTETTLSGAFAGERITFTGIATQTRGVTTLVRYAITCCRADAAPVAVRLGINVPGARGWMRADGVFVQTPGGIVLRPGSLRRIEPPADAFIYR